MVTKRQPINEEVARNMEERSIGSPSAHTDTLKTTYVTLSVTDDAPKPTKLYKNNIVSVRFDEGDYEQLKEIALEQGTNAAALIRKAVKDIIRGKGSI